jgi:hypothetical protein
MADIIERLRKHVNNRGGPSIANGAWEMMLEAATEIEQLRAASLGMNGRERTPPDVAGNVPASKPYDQSSNPATGGSNACGGGDIA